MRKYLFRGKDIAGKWHYGDLEYFTDDFVKIVCHSEHEYGKMVIPSTVGQYTGLRDNAGIMIYEGDVCKDSLGNLFEVQWDSENARFLGFMIGVERRICYVGREPRVEVLGNIHDNTELLKKKK